MVLLLPTGRCYGGEICVILFLLRCPFIRYPFWPKSNFSDSGQKPWTIIRRFDRNQAHSLWSFYSSLEGATELKFAPFCSFQRGLSNDTSLEQFQQSPPLTTLPTLTLVNLRSNDTSVVVLGQHDLTDTAQQPERLLLITVEQEHRGNDIHSLAVPWPRERRGIQFIQGDSPVTLGKFP